METVMDTAEQLERDAENRRAKVENTLDQLKDRMSVEQMVGEIGRFVGLNDAGATLRNLGRQVQANPLAVGMVGIGIAWLVMGGKSKTADPANFSTRRWDDAIGGLQDQGQDTGLADAASRSLSGVKDAVEDATTRASHLAGAARDRVQGAVADVRDGATSIGRQAASRLEDNPLLVGGIAAVLGTVVGVALPRTATENALMGRQSDDLIEGAKEASLLLRDRATEAAQRTYTAAVASAREEGLLPSGDETLTSKLSTVAEAALDTARDEVDPILHGEKADRDQA